MASNKDSRHTKTTARPTFGQRCTALLAAGIAKFFQWSPNWLAYAIADSIAPLVAWRTKRRQRQLEKLRRGMVRNQRIVLRDEWSPELSAAHIRHWARHTTRLLVDICRIPRMKEHNVHELIDLTDFDEHIRPLHAEGKGVICVSGHLGCWEISGHSVSLLGVPVLTVVRNSRNPALAQVIRRIRESGGQQVSGKWGALRPLRRALADGLLIGIAADENADTNPIFEPFLGTLAASNATAAALARRSGAPIVVVSVNRTSRGRWKMIVWDVIRVDPNALELDDRAALTRRINDGLSRAIVAYPDQWLWGLRRFKTRPEGEEPDADGLPPRSEGWEDPAREMADNIRAL